MQAVVMDMLNASGFAMHMLRLAKHLLAADAAARKHFPSYCRQAWLKDLKASGPHSKV